MSTSMNVKNLIILKNSSFSTHNSSLLLFTNLSGIIDGLIKLSSYSHFISHNHHLACRDLQRDIAHSKSCGDSPRMLPLYMITSSPLFIDKQKIGWFYYIPRWHHHGSRMYCYHCRLADTEIGP